jgi:hypothetical protein
MARIFLGSLFVLILLACSLLAQEGIQRGKLKAVDLDRGAVTIIADGKECEYHISDQTRFFDVKQKGKAGLKEAALKPGLAVLFKADSKDVLIGLKIAGPGRPVQPPVDTSHLVPLPEMGTSKYQGFQGGLYPGGKNRRPPEHEAAGLRLAQAVVPRDRDGRPDPQGKIVLLSIGMSNTAQASEGFARHLAGFPQKNPALVFVNGAQGGMTASAIQDPDDQASGTRYWTTVDERLKRAGVTRAQVQAVWIKEADAGPKEGFPAYAKKLQRELTRVVQVLPPRFPNLKLAYLSSRTYGGYATTPLNPEPYAYESGFSVRWLIEEQLQGSPALNFDPKKGKVMFPWLSWGPYLWANGTKNNKDGLSYEASDFGPDGTHHAASGVDKLGRRLLQFFTSDSTTRPWLCAS